MTETLINDSSGYDNEQQNIEPFSILTSDDDEIEIKKAKDIIRYIRQIKCAKTKTKCRNKQLDPDGTSGIGYITEVLISKFLEIPTCFDITDNFCNPKYDILEHEDWGIIDCKGSSLHNDNSGRNYYWSFSIRNNTKPDFFFCIGYDENRKHVLLSYYIPNDVNISKLTTLRINANWTPEEDPYYWFKQDPKLLNDIYHTLSLENCPVLRLRNVI